MHWSRSLIDWISASDTDSAMSCLRLCLRNRDGRGRRWRATSRITTCTSSHLSYGTYTLTPFLCSLAVKSVRTQQSAAQHTFATVPPGESHAEAPSRLAEPNRLIEGRRGMKKSRVSSTVLSPSSLDHSQPTSESFLFFLRGRERAEAEVKRSEARCVEKKVSAPSVMVS